MTDRPPPTSIPSDGRRLPRQMPPWYEGAADWYMERVLWGFVVVVGAPLMLVCAVALLPFALLGGLTRFLWDREEP